MRATRLASESGVRGLSSESGGTVTPAAVQYLNPYHWDHKVDHWQRWAPRTTSDSSELDSMPVDRITRAVKRRRSWNRMLGFRSSKGFPRYLIAMVVLSLWMLIYLLSNRWVSGNNYLNTNDPDFVQFSNMTTLTSVSNLDPENSEQPTDFIRSKNKEVLQSQEFQTSLISAPFVFVIITISF